MTSIFSRNSPGKWEKIDIHFVKFNTYSLFKNDAFENKLPVYTFHLCA